MANISEVISWKFNNQPGMKCEQDINGVLTIVQFPGGVPTQAEQNLWIAEYESYVSSNRYLEDQADKRITDDRFLRTIFEVLFTMENRIRALESRQPITLSDFRDYIFSRYRVM